MTWLPVGARTADGYTAPVEALIEVPTKFTLKLLRLDGGVAEAVALEPEV